MTATGRIFWIETRRDMALLAFPFLVGLALLAWFIRDQESTPGVVLWPDVSENIGYGAMFLGPAAGGLAAWAAGRDRRYGLGDLLKTTSRPQTARQFSQLSGTMVWILLAHLAAGLVLGFTAALEEPWGDPVPAPILIGTLAVAAQTAIGYLAGSVVSSPVQSRLTAALVPIALFFAAVVPTVIRGEDQPCGMGCLSSNYPYENLSPIALIQGTGGSIFWAPPADIIWAAYAWFGGLGILALTLIAARNQPRSRLIWATAVLACLGIVFGARELVPSPVVDTASSSHAIDYEPVCVQRSIPVCLHPAYESVLDDTANLIDPIVRPLVGIRGAPTHAEQIRPPNDESRIGWLDVSPPDTISAEPAETGSEALLLATATAISAVRISTDDPFALTPAQSALAIWLMRQAGWDPAEEIDRLMRFPDISTEEEYDQTVTAVLAAADRFAALTPEEQHAWLETNLAPLRTGSLTLEDLP